MSKHDLINKLNKLNLDNNIPEELKTKTKIKTKHNKRNKVSDEEENKKYIKEMHEFADKNEFRSNAIFLGIGIFSVAVVILIILLNTVFMKPKADLATKKAVVKTTIDSASPKVEDVKPIDAQAKIFEYLNVETNRTDLLKKAVELNKGSQKGVTVYLLSEILRSNTIDVPASTSSVDQLMKYLTSIEWKRNTDLTQLKKGDICFTTDMQGKVGTPSHVYVFMGWVEEGKTDYANICDGQVEEYGNILHTRNLSIATTKKDKFSFFLRK